MAENPSENADLFNPVDQMETVKTWLSLISDAREDIDCGTVVNLIKSIYAMREHRDTLVEESLERSIEMILRLLEAYISKSDSDSAPELADEF